MTNLSASAERNLYLTDRPAWLAYVAPRMADKLRTPPVDVGAEWAALRRDYQRAVWPLLDAVTRECIRLARAPTPRTVPGCPQPETPIREAATHHQGIPA